MSEQETHTLYKSSTVRGRFALDSEEGPTLSTGQPVTLKLGRYAIPGHIETDTDTSHFVPDGGNFRDDHIELRAGLTVRA